MHDAPVECRVFFHRASLGMADDDSICIRRCLDGDVDAFDELVDKYQKPVFNAVYRIVLHYEDAREVTQQVFMKVFENLPRFDPHRKFFSWLYRVAINESLNFVSSRRPEDGLNHDVEHPDPSPEQSLQTSETRRDVQQALTRLSIDHRVVIILKHFLHLSYREAAEILQIPEKTFKSRLFTARRELKITLEKMGYEGRNVAQHG